MTTIGSTFSGVGGLDMAVAAVFGAEPSWFVENDDDAARVLTHHWPDVPNLGDITTVNWSQVPRVDLLTAGFPCQDLSPAGLQAGMRPDTRSGLWFQAAYAIAELRPPLVVIENVRGLLTSRGAEPTEELLAAEAERDKCDRVLDLIERKHRRAVREGKDFYARHHATDRVRILVRRKRAVVAIRRADARIVRAIGTVLGSLADLGYDAVWCGLPAADVGAPHGRFRIFILAWPAAADPGSQAGRELGPRLRAGRPARIGRGRPDDGGASAGQHGEPAADPDRARREGIGPVAGEPELDDAQRDPAPAALAPDRRRGERHPSAAGQQGRPDAGPGGAGVVPDPDSECVRQQPVAERRSGGQAVARGVGAGTDADAAGPRRREPRSVPAGAAEGAGSASVRSVGRGGDGAVPDPDRSGRDQLGRQRPGECDPDRCGDPDQAGHAAEPATRADDADPDCGRRGADEPRLPAREFDPTRGGDGGDAAAAVTERGGCPRWPREPQRGPEGRDAAARDSPVDWGIYGPAIRRWQLILGRPAPAPAAPTSRNGGYQLTGEFDEWMMGWPAGHVTDPRIWLGMTRQAARNAQLRLCGNGVVPQQAGEALRRLLPHVLAATTRIG